MIVVLILLAAAAGLWVTRSGGAWWTIPAETDWLPTDLHDAELAWSEATFTCDNPVPMVVRIDRAYKGNDARLTLVEFKRRASPRTYLSDVVELSAQRYVLQRSGHTVHRQAHVVVMPIGEGFPRALMVNLEDAASVERRVMRFLTVRNMQQVPRGPAHETICRGCGHQKVCRLRKA